MIRHYGIIDSLPSIKRGLGGGLKYQHSGCMPPNNERTTNKLLSICCFQYAALNAILSICYSRYVAFNMLPTTNRRLLCAAFASVIRVVKPVYARR